MANNSAELMENKRAFRQAHLFTIVIGVGRFVIGLIGVGPRQVFDIANQFRIKGMNFCLRTGFWKPKIPF